MNIVKNKHY